MKQGYFLGTSTTIDQDRVKTLLQRNKLYPVLQTISTEHWMLWASMQGRLFRYHMQNYFGPPQSPLIGAETSGPVTRVSLGFVQRLMYVLFVGLAFFELFVGRRNKINTKLQGAQYLSVQTAHQSDEACCGSEPKRTSH
jgi:hypothetical protein